MDAAGIEGAGHHRVQPAIAKFQRSPDLEIVIQAEAVGRRLDVFLSLQRSDFSRSHFKKMIQDGGVLVNGAATKPSYEARTGDRVAVWLPLPAEQQQLTPQALPLKILFEDHDLLVVNKDPGIVVHPGAGHADGTLVHGLLAHCSRLALQGAPLRPGIVHRLDQGTSGVIVVAKSELAYLGLIQQFKQHSVAKEYLALVYGALALPCGEIRTLLDRHPGDRKKMAVVQGRGREAITRWQVEQEWGEVTLLRVAIETGRTHQIRVHLSHLQHPVVGDSVYGGGKRRARALKAGPLRDLLLPVERQMLHAWQLAIDHPRNHERLRFEAPLAQDFASLLEALDRVSGS
jgi:23S rRNA pseudouridine1911/1915/1917 synthase